MHSLERWNHIYEVASEQSGYFDVDQAAQSGFSLQLLKHHENTGRIRRVRRGIYRLAHFPSGEHEDLVVLWLWSERLGIFSHSTALALHELSDYLPMRYHMTVPSNWKTRRLRVPESLQLHYADVPSADLTRFGCFSITSVQRTLEDCRLAQMSPEWLEQAEAQARQRGPGSATKAAYRCCDLGPSL